MISEGDTVPNFKLQDASGNTVQSKDYQGKKYILYFYPKDFTPGCTTQADEFSKMYKEFKKNNVEVIGISPDNVESHDKFCKKINIPYILLSDEEKIVSKAFDVWGKKVFMGREYTGVKRSTFLVNEKGVIFKTYRNVKPAGHAMKVLKDFESIK